MACHRAVRLWHRREDAAPDAGFTVVEVIVSMGIFAIIAAAVVAAVVGGINAQAATRDRVGASNIAQSDLEQARSQPTPSPTAYATTPSGGGGSYQVQRTVAVPTPCPNGSDVRISVVVTGPGASTRQVRMDTLLACGNP